MGTRIVALVAATAVLAITGGCGTDDEAGSSATLSSVSLAGTWVERDGPLIVRFTRDGKFAIDGDGSLKDGEYVKGRYTVEGSKARFAADELGPRGCGGQKWEWELSLSDSRRLDAQNLDDVCETAAGTRWSLVKRSDS
jgi:hypothetical protein